MIAVIFFAVIFIMFFVAKTSKLDKFIGNWKRIDKAEDTLSINKVFDAIIIFSGRRSVAAEFNEDKSILKAHLFSPASVITYNDTTGHILINKGREGEFERLK